MKRWHAWLVIAAVVFQALVYVGLLFGGIYVAIHFINKFW